MIDGSPGAGDAPADHSDDPRAAGVASGGYSEEQPGDGDGRRKREQEDDQVRSVDGDAGQATGNPHAAGADPKWAAHEPD